MKHLKQYLEALKQGQAVELVESLSDADRIELRAALKANGCKNLVRSLFYNYKTQKWI